MGNKTKKSNSIMQAAGILVLTSFLSRIIGYIRDIVITSSFGLNYMTDAYYAAFTIPDMIYYCLVGGALSSAFIPVFSSYISRKENEDGYVMSSTILNLVSILAAFLCLMGEIFAPQLVNLLVQFEGESYTLTVLLTRIMFCQSFFMCLTGISQGILQSYKHFSSPAMGAVLYNITIIVVGLILSRVFDLGIMGFSIGVVFGAIVNFAVQIPAMKRFGFQYKLVIDLKHPGVKKFFALLLPVLLGLSMNELNLLANQYFGSGLGESILSALKNSQRIMQLPVGIFGSAIGLSIFPTMTEHFANGKIAMYKRDLSMSLRTVLFITVPSAAGLIALRVPVIRAMYYQGNFTNDNVNQVATLLMFYSIGIVGYSAQQILNRGFYSIQDTKTPVKINIFILILNIILSYIFVKIGGASGLALSYSLSGLISMALLYIFLRNKIGGFNGREILESFIKTLIATAVMFVVIVILTHIMDNTMNLTSKLMQIVEVILGTAVGVVVYFITALILKMDEVMLVKNMLQKKFKKH